MPASTDHPVVRTADGGVRLAVILLAAGRASRFGGGKLAVLLAGSPVAEHAASSLRDLPCAWRLCVQGSRPVPVEGFTDVPLDAPDAPLSASIRAGVTAAEALGADAVLLALADMPLVPTAHHRALLGAFDGDRIASRAHGQPMPPAVFGRRHFAALKALSGDRGAGALLRDAPFVTLAAEHALDIDTPADLVRAEAALASWRGKQAG